jgi:hypothetical protein
MKRVAASFACADWLSDFQDTYINKSIDLAVENAMKEGIKPDVIAGKSLAFDEKLNPENLINALYCTGVTGQEVYGIAQEYNISDLIVTAGFNKCVAGCGDRVADTQPYTPGSPAGGKNFPRPTPRPRSVSPSTF